MSVVDDWWVFIFWGVQAESQTSLQNSKRKTGPSCFTVAPAPCCLLQTFPLKTLRAPCYTIRRLWPGTSLMSLLPASSASTARPQHNELFARPRSLNSNPPQQFVPAKVRFNEHVKLIYLLILVYLTTPFQLQCYILVISNEIWMS